MWVSLPRLILPSLKRHPMGCTLVTYIGSLFLLSLPPPIVIPKDSFGSFFIATVFSWVTYPWGKSYKGMTVQYTDSLMQLTWEAQIQNKITEHPASLIQSISAMLPDGEVSFSCTCSGWKHYSVSPKCYHQDWGTAVWESKLLPAVPHLFAVRRHLLRGGLSRPGLSSNQPLSGY